MASTTKRSWKLQDFVAHGANVNCLALGHKSGRVLVTGGDDKKVNLWAVGKPNCIMSLSGHTTPVECVRFGHTEELVCAGSQSGALKIWDLEAAKIVRTLTGHKASIRCVDFHPYGDFLSSGSLDTYIKLWDIRRKGCIFTYKGHNLSVNSLKFSPDGQWIASAGEDGRVKLWDLRAGRLLTEFTDHTGPVMDVEFHPHEFLLASGSADRTVNFWDLENFQLVSTTEGDSGAVRCIYFSPAGECLFSGSQDLLKVYGWEPARVHDTVPIGWGKVQDIATAQNQLIGASFHMTSVVLYVVDLKRVQPFCGLPNTEAGTTSFTYGHSIRKSFIKHQPPNGAKTRLDVKTIEESDKSGTDPEDDTQSVADIKEVNDYREIFQPSRAHPLMPQVIQSLETSREPARVEPERIQSVPVPEMVVTDEPVKQAPVCSSPRTKREYTRVNSCRESSYSFPETDFPIKLSTIRHSPSEPALNRPNPTHARSSSLSRNFDNKTEPTATYSKPLDKPAAVRPPPKPSPEVCVPMDTSEYPVMITKAEKEDFVPMISDKPTGLDLDDFLPRSYQRSVGSQHTFPEMSESEVFSSIMRGHESMMTVLTNRQRNLQIVYSLWHNKDIKAAVESAISMKDSAVVVDLLGVLTLRPSIWNLDLCVSLLPSIYDLLQSKYELYMTVGCNSLRLILRNFAPVIKTNIAAPTQTVGVDISREERYTKCVKCYNNLISIRAFLLKRQTLQGKLGHVFRELHILMQGLD